MKLGSGNRVSGLDNYTESEHKYYDLIISWKEKSIGNPFKHDEGLFLKLCRAVGFKSFTEEAKAQKRKETSIANLPKKEPKILPIWTGRRTPILKPESQAVKDCIIRLGANGAWFTRSDAKEAIKSVLTNLENIDSTIHSQLLVLKKHGIVKKVGEGKSQKGITGKKKINYYALV